jgi:hypothetical protein
VNLFDNVTMNVSALPVQMFSKEEVIAECVKSATLGIRHVLWLCFGLCMLFWLRTMLSDKSDSRLLWFTDWALMGISAYVGLTALWYAWAWRLP